MGHTRVQDKIELPDTPNAALQDDHVTGIELKGNLAPAVDQVSLRWIGGRSRIGKAERQEHQAEKVEIFHGVHPNRGCGDADLALERLEPPCRAHHH